MPHLIQLALGAVMCSLGVKGCTKSWEAHVGDVPFGENERIDIGKCQRLWKVGNAWINKVSAMRPGLAKIIETVHISRNVESAEIDLHIAAMASWIDFAHTGLPKQVPWLSKIQSTNRSTIYYGRDSTVEFNSGDAWVSLPITRIHLWVAQDSKIQLLPATLHRTWWMDHHQAWHGNFEEILILDPVDIEMAYGYSASHCHYLQWHVRSYGWRYLSFIWDEDWIEGRLVLRRSVCATEPVQLLCWSHFNACYVTHLCTHPWSMPKVAII